MCCVVDCISKVCDLDYFQYVGVIVYIYFIFQKFDYDICFMIFLLICSGCNNSKVCKKIGINYFMEDEEVNVLNVKEGILMLIV